MQFVKKLSLRDEFMMKVSGKGIAWVTSCLRALCMMEYRTAFLFFHL